MTIVTLIALVLAILGCAFILFIGARFLLAPKVALAGFGVPDGRSRALTSVKGVRDLTSGIVPLVVLAVAGPQVFGWALIAAAITPIGDAIIVATNGGTLRHALTVHASTAALLIIVGLVLGLAG